MKALVLSNLYPPDVMGGYEIGCGQLVDALRARGHDVRVVAGAPRRPLRADPPHVSRRFALADEWNAGAAAAAHPAVRRSCEVESRVVNSYNVYAFLDELRRFGPDVVLFSNLVGLGGLGLVGCAQHMGVPWVWHLGDYTPLELCSTGDGLAPGLASLFARHVRGHFIAVSTRVVQGNSFGGLALNGHVEVIPYWFQGQRSTAEAARAPGGLRVVSVGRLDRQKGTDLLIEAAALMRDGGLDDFRVDLVGANADPEFSSMVRRLDLARHVRFLGTLDADAVSSLYGDYDVLAFPTRVREPFGLVALEAAARGCVPMISHDCGVAEWLVHGVHCLKVERSAAAVAETLRAAADGRTDLPSLARRARAAVWNDFHLDVIVPKIESVLGRAVDDARAEGRKPGSASEAYRLACLAEQLTHRMADEALSA